MSDDHPITDAAKTVRAMGACVIGNGPEPNYAGEKLHRALRAAVEGLAEVERAYREREASWSGPQGMVDYEPSYTAEDVAKIARDAFERVQRSHA